MFKPTTFGKFFLYEKLAIGGMAEIFKAKLYGIAGFEKTLVVKQILPEYASDVEFVNMFIDEANIAVSLTHGNIVPIYELGKIGDRYYIAMEYVDGENLETVIDQCRKLKREIPINLAVEIAIETCKGLDYAHKKSGPEGKTLGIVHRDVSPQNIMVSFDGEVKIVDFGIAKAASKLSLTRVGTLKGKFGYMSPEQALGNEVDRRTDIYAVGIVLYECLTGTRLYDAENDLDLLKKVRNGAVLPPKLVNSQLSADLDRIVLKALAKNIEERYQEAGQFQLDLQRWLFSQPPRPGAETLSSFMRSLFRREGAPRAKTPPVPGPRGTGSAPASLGPAPGEEKRSRRDLSFAQNQEIARALDEATNEARRVMGDAPSAPSGPSIREGSIEALLAQPTGKVQAFSETTTTGGEDPGLRTEQILKPSPRPPAPNEQEVEWDETTDQKVRKKVSDPMGPFVEAPRSAGPRVRVPNRDSLRGQELPWTAGPVPAPLEDNATRTSLPWEEPPTRTTGRAVLEEPPAEARPRPSAPPVNVGEPPLFSDSRKRAARRKVPLRVLGGALALAALAGGAYALRGEVTPEPTPRRAPTSPSRAVVPGPVGAGQSARLNPSTGGTVPSPVRSLPASSTPPAVASSPVLASASVTPFSTTAHTPTPPPVPARTSAQRIASLSGYGTVSVQATPWGEVKIDGKPVHNTPLYHYRVKAGPHTVVVTSNGKSETRHILVHPNQDEEPIVVNF